MEYVSGGELFDYIVHKVRLRESEGRRLFQQVISGIEFCHSHLICHRYIKPENLLLDRELHIKIADFGLVREIRAKPPFTEYVSTRWYRAPEVILSWRKYTAAIDVWSVGCILAELIIRKPLLPAASEEEQLNMITKLLGNPSPKLVN